MAPSALEVNWQTGATPKQKHTRKEQRVHCGANISDLEAAAGKRSELERRQQAGQTLLGRLHALPGCYQCPARPASLYISTSLPAVNKVHVLSSCSPAHTPPIQQEQSGAKVLRSCPPEPRIPYLKDSPLFLHSRPKGGCEDALLRTFNWHKESDARETSPSWLGLSRAFMHSPPGDSQGWPGSPACKASCSPGPAQLLRVPP